MKGSGSQIRLHWIYGAFLISLGAILAHDLIPAKIRVLAPGSDFVSLYSDSGSGGTTRGEWINARNYHYRCIYQSTPAPYKFCGLDIIQGDGSTRGVDLTGYDFLHLKVSYFGNAQMLRVYLRNFSPHYTSEVTDNRITKYNRMLIPVGDLRSELSLRLDQFTVADWWINRHGASPSLLTPELNNVVNIGLDTPHGTPVGVHEFKIESIRLSGEWISRENWYLTIAAFWFAALVLFTLRHLLNLRHQVKMHAAKLTKALSEARDIQRQSEKFRELSMLDELTSTLNRRGILQLVDDWNASGQWPDTALILMDIDHFKRINDRFGHQAGDRVLASIGEVLRENIRSRDHAGRWGGEEFVLLCPQCTSLGATTIAEKILKSIRNKEFIFQDSFRVTLSAGISIAGEGESFESVYRRADQALYLAKRSGRNCIMVANQGEAA